MFPFRWMQEQPHLLEVAYRLTERALQGAKPLLQAVGWEPLETIFETGEKITKGPLFECKMCGMCNLRGTGMTCPMTCPKEMRNGPCGGVRPDGKCEVKPEMDCIWLLGWQRAERMPDYGESILGIHPPVDYQLEGSSAWINMLTERDQQSPEGWQESPGHVEFEV